MSEFVTIRVFADRAARLTTPSFGALSTSVRERFQRCRPAVPPRRAACKARPMPDRDGEQLPDPAAGAATAAIPMAGAVSGGAVSGGEVAGGEVAGGAGSGGAVSVGLVGFGRAGRALAVALVAAGHPVRAVSARSASTRAVATEVLPGARLCGLGGVGDGVDLILLTVSDDAIGPVASSLAASGAVRAGQVVAHASGRHGLEVLRPAAEAGAARLALHPIMTLPSPAAGSIGPGPAGPWAGSAASVSLAGVTFGVTADPGARPLAERLVTDLGGRLAWIAERDRVLYHSAFALGANYVATLVAVAAEQLAIVGLADPADALRPLLAATVANTLERGTAAMTGPAARGDASTVEAHLAALLRYDPTVADAYAALAELTLDRLGRPSHLEPPDRPVSPVPPAWPGPAGAGAAASGTEPADGLTGRRAALRRAIRAWRAAHRTDAA
jgi:predicted short-subunit dehydrogenase-like oxidoreductase (DUF2520 family)